MPRLIYIYALDFSWPRRQYARRRGSPSELGVTDEFGAIVAYESLDPRIGDLGYLNGLAIGARTMSVHVLARIGGAEGRTKGALCKGRQPCCVYRLCSSSGRHGSFANGRLTAASEFIAGLGIGD